MPIRTIRFLNSDMTSKNLLNEIKELEIDKEWKINNEIKKKYSTLFMPEFSITIFTNNATVASSYAIKKFPSYVVQSWDELRILPYKTMKETIKEICNIYSLNKKLLQFAT